MDQAVKAKWLEALRSGEYLQGKGALNQAGKFCCLGVLCDVAVNSGVPVSVYDGLELGVQYDGISGGLPASVSEWAGLHDSEVRDSADPVVSNDPLSRWNDAHDADFNAIADLIEEYL